MLFLFINKTLWRNKLEQLWMLTHQWILFGLKQVNIYYIIRYMTGSLILTVSFYYYHHLQKLHIFFCNISISIPFDDKQTSISSFNIVSFLSNLKLLPLRLIYLAAKESSHQLFFLNKAISTFYSCWKNHFKFWKNLSTISKFKSFLTWYNFNLI